MAWSAAGLVWQVTVDGKTQPPWCRDSRLEDSDGLQVWVDTRATLNVHRASRFCHRFMFLPRGGGSGGRSADGRPVAHQPRPRERPPVRPRELDSAGEDRRQRLHAVRRSPRRRRSAASTRRSSRGWGSPTRCSTASAGCRPSPTGPGVSLRGRPKLLGRAAAGRRLSGGRRARGNRPARRADRCAAGDSVLRSRSDAIANRAARGADHAVGSRRRHADRLVTPLATAAGGEQHQRQQ